MNRRTGTSSHALLALLAALVAPATVPAQILPAAKTPPETRDAAVDTLVARALVVNPSVHAARERTRAAHARIGPAGTLSDPMLGVSVMNLPVSDPGYSDGMTMNTLAVGQTLPFPGKLPLARRAAESELDAALARLRATELDIAAQVRHEYYDLVYLDRALEILRANERLLVNLIEVAESRYGVGTGGQEDALKARVEAARIAERAVDLIEERRAALARLNALLDRPSETPVVEPRVPERIARAAVADDPSRIRFASVSLGARAADSPLPSLEETQQRAIRTNPLLWALDAGIAAQTARVDLASRAHLPDFDLSVQYGQRPDRSDMVSFMVSVAIPVRRGDRQDEEVAGAGAELAALQAEHDALVNQIRSGVAERYTDLERDRAQLALIVKSVIPQGRAALEAATAAFQVGRADFMTLIESQAVLYDYETAYFRALTDFAKGIAELERLVGEEVLP